MSTTGRGDEGRCRSSHLVDLCPPFERFGAAAGAVAAGHIAVLHAQSSAHRTTARAAPTADRKSRETILARLGIRDGRYDAVREEQRDGWSGERRARVGVFVQEAGARQDKVGVLPALDDALSPPEDAFLDRLGRRMILLGIVDRFRIASRDLLGQKVVEGDKVLPFDLFASSSVQRSSCEEVSECRTSGWSLSRRAVMSREAARVEPKRF